MILMLEFALLSLFQYAQYFFKFYLTMEPYLNFFLTMELISWNVTCNIFHC